MTADLEIGATGCGDKCGSVLRIGRRELVRLTLLLLLLALLHLLHDLLGVAGRPADRHGGAHRLRLGLRLWGLGVVVVVVGLVGPGCVGAGGSLAGAQQDLARSAVALIADHQHVIAGALQKLRENVLGLARPVDAEDPLIAGEAFNLCAGVGAHFFEDLLQAGVGGGDAEALAVPTGTASGIGAGSK
jgi:hypothetical protein